MCRNIRVLHHFEPPTTPEEIRAAALQYVRKVSGMRASPAAADTAEVERAVEAVTKATTRLLERLPQRGAPRTREGERARAKARWSAREARMMADGRRKEAARR
jgi:hypothetical protein